MICLRNGCIYGGLNFIGMKRTALAENRSSVNAIGTDAIEDNEDEHRQVCHLH
jgi:hypothetical protein